MTGNGGTNPTGDKIATPVELVPGGPMKYFSHNCGPGNPVSGEALVERSPEDDSGLMPRRLGSSGDSAGAALVVSTEAWGTTRGDGFSSGDEERGSADVGGKARAVPEGGAGARSKRSAGGPTVDR